MTSSPRGYITVLAGDLNPDLPTHRRFQPVLDQFAGQWATPTPELLQAVLDGLNLLTIEPPGGR